MHEAKQGMNTHSRWSDLIIVVFIEHPCHQLCPAGANPRPGSADSVTCLTRAPLRRLQMCRKCQCAHDQCWWKPLEQEQNPRPAPAGLRFEFKENAVFDRNSFFIFSPLSEARGRGRGDNRHIFLCLMVLARRTIMVTKYNMLERCCQYQDHLRCWCPFLLPIFTHCMSLIISIPYYQQKWKITILHTVLLCTIKSDFGLVSNSLVLNITINSTLIQSIVTHTYVTWLNHICDTTDSHMCRVSFVLRERMRYQRICLDQIPLTEWIWFYWLLLLETEV